MAAVVGRSVSGLLVPRNLADGKRDRNAEFQMLLGLPDSLIKVASRS